MEFDGGLLWHNEADDGAMAKCLQNKNCSISGCRQMLFQFIMHQYIVHHILVKRPSSFMCYASTGDLAKAVRNRSDIHFGLYHSMFEWFHPLFLEDRANNFTTTKFVQVGSVCFYNN